MFDFVFNKDKMQRKPINKIIFTILLLLIFRLGNVIPIPGVDQGMIKDALLKLESSNPIFQMISMYSGHGANPLTPFSLGVVPYINASIIVDLLGASFSYFERLQSEEGDFGKKKIFFYKKVLALIFATAQSLFLLGFIKNYFYHNNLGTSILTCALLVSGSMSIVWLTSLIDSYGLGNGVSTIILTNIVAAVLEKQVSIFQGVFTVKFVFEIMFLLFLIVFICISQTARITINVVSARQLAFLESKEKTLINTKSAKQYYSNENGLSIRLNQAGIFPLIIASNLLPFINSLGGSIFLLNPISQKIIYYFLVIGFNYFYTTLFWDPEKISEQLRKASVSIINVSPGQQTVSYLENVARASSIVGGIFLCFILFCYDLLKQVINGALLNQVNVSSLIIVVGVAYEIQKSIRALNKNNLEDIC
jgi:preprotein translocase subunit SecY